MCSRRPRGVNRTCSRTRPGSFPPGPASLWQSEGVGAGTVRVLLADRISSRPLICGGCHLTAGGAGGAAFFASRRAFSHARRHAPKLSYPSRSHGSTFSPVETMIRPAAVASLLMIPSSLHNHYYNTYSTFFDRCFDGTTRVHSKRGECTDGFRKSPLWPGQRFRLAELLDLISRPCLYRTVPERHLAIPPEERAPRRVTGYTYLGHSLG